MVSFSGIPCPKCSKEFNEAKDDIVVCPYCGAPYHRVCYNAEGKCLFEDKHADNFVFKSNVKTEKIIDKNENRKICPVCFHSNNKCTNACVRCGTVFIENSDIGSKFSKFPVEVVNQLPQFMTDPLNGIKPDEEISEIKSLDIAKFIQNRTFYYLPVFKNIFQENKSKFNISAFLFHGIWFLYRKQYKLGGIITASAFLLLISRLFVTTFFSINIEKNVLNSLGISSVTNVTQLFSFYEKIFSGPSLQVFLYFLPYILWILFFILMLICGFSGNKFYFNHVISKIKDFKEENKNDKKMYEALLFEKGGVNRGISWCFIICQFLLYTFYLFTY